MVVLPYRLVLLIFFSSLLLYAVGVSEPFQVYCANAVLQGDTVPQAMQYVLVMESGMVLGVAVGGMLGKGLATLERAVTAANASSLHRSVHPALSVALLSAGGLIALLFVLPGFDRFVTSHAEIRVEVEVVAYVMGVLSGGAWVWLLGRRAWWGLLFSATMILMLVSNTLSLHSWP